VTIRIATKSFKNQNQNTKEIFQKVERIFVPEAVLANTMLTQGLKLYHLNILELVTNLLPLEVISEEPKVVIRILN
jgi:hypothetical protein